MNHIKTLQELKDNEQLSPLEKHIYYLFYMAYNQRLSLDTLDLNLKSTRNIIIKSIDNLVKYNLIIEINDENYPLFHNIHNTYINRLELYYTLKIEEITNE